MGEAKFLFSPSLFDPPSKPTVKLLPQAVRRLAGFRHLCTDRSFKANFELTDTASPGAAVSPYPGGQGQDLFRWHQERMSCAREAG